MENTGENSEGRGDSDTDDSRSEQENPANGAADANAVLDKVKGMDPHYDTNPNRHNFGLDDSPLDSAEWNKDSKESDTNTEGTGDTEQAQDDESAESEDDSLNWDDRNISFDRDI